MQELKSFLDAFLSHAWDIALYPLDPSNRIYYVYLGSSVLFAFAIYAVKKRRAEKVEGERTFLGFLFPKKSGVIRQLGWMSDTSSFIS